MSFLSNYYQDTKDMLSDSKFYESYARFNEEKNRYETWAEAIDRVMNMHRTFYKDKWTDELENHVNFATDAYKKKLVLGAQRALQFGGEQLLRHQMKNYNCSASHASRPEFFGETFYILLCGSGVGFSVQKEHIEKLPAIINRTKNPKIHVVEDSIEGWATSVDVLMSSFFENGGKHPEFRGHRVYFDLSKIRPKGSMISGGFKAPGPDGLRLSLDRIEHLLQGIVLRSKKVKMRPIHVYDIVMHISDAVLSGGLRRSASICIFSHDDEEMMKAKTGNWFVENPQRGRSNNSAMILRESVTKEEFKKLIQNVKEFGEPGFVFSSSIQHMYNPCCEISLYPIFDDEIGFQMCNLSEINGGMCENEHIFYEACKAASILGTLQAGYTNFKFVTETTRKLTEREALIGVSITGWMSNPKILFDEEILKNGAELVKETNREVAKLIGINSAARTTCVKPSGNASVLLKTPSGIHPEHSKRYFRNVQMNKEAEVVQLIKEKNPYMVEDSVWSASNTDYVISFPVISKKGTLYKKDIKGVNHLEYVKKAQRTWVEYGTDESRCVDPNLRHNVSNTILVDNWEEVTDFLYENRNYFAGVSLLPEVGDKIYEQAPFTEVLSHEEIVEKYGTGSIFASGLIVDGLKIFDNNLWKACSYSIVFIGNNEVSTENTLKNDWARRFHKFATNYFNGNLTLTEMCLKDVFLLHRWEKIQQNLKPVDFKIQLSKKKYVDIDTMGASACGGVNERGESNCLV